MCQLEAQSCVLDLGPPRSARRTFVAPWVGPSRGSSGSMFREGSDSRAECFSGCLMLAPLLQGLSKGRELIHVASLVTSRILRFVRAFVRQSLSCSLT